MMCVLIYFLNFDSIDSRLIELANVALGLRYQHNDLESSRSLIEFLESYFKLSMYNKEQEKACNFYK